MNKLEDYFYNKPKKLPVHKWLHYFDVYDRHFSKFIGKNPVILEIGVAQGGSLEMWDYYFDGKCQIYGIDVNPECKDVPEKLQKDNIKVFIGSQDDREFLKKIKEEIPKIDIIIEDGGHLMNQQIITYEELYDHLSDDGVFLSEDLHTSYWPEYGSFYKNPNSFIEYTKNFIDYINAYHIREKVDLHFRKTTKSIHYYDSIIVLERKKDLQPPDHLMKH